MQSPKPASAERRAALLHAAARVAKSVTTILDPDELLRRAVNIICDEFGFYYAGIFLTDETGRWAVLRTGHGEAGAAMVAQGHKLEVGGQSMVGAATGQGEARIALDVGEERVRFRNPHLPHTRSEMALPLMVGNEILGAVTVQSVEEAAFTQEDIIALQAMADQIAIALQNGFWYRQVQDLLGQSQRRSRLLAATSQVGQQATSILDLDELLPKTVDIVCDAYGFYYAGVFLMDESGEWAVLRAGRGEAGAAMLAEGHRLKVGGDSMIGAATGRREARIALDVGEEPVHFKNPHLPHTRSEMALPLIVGDQVLGAVTIQSVQGAAFNEDDITTLETMADHLAVAIRNAQLIEELEKAHAELLRTKTYEALATATTQAIHWIGNKALPMTTSVARMQADLNSGRVDADSLREDLELVAESARQIVQVKENLLGPAREHRPRPAMLSDVVQAAVFHAGIPAQQVTLEAAPDAPMALADTTQLARAFGNLLQNAVEAKARHIRVAIQPASKKGFVSVRVADDGEGIPPDMLDAVWASFVTTKAGRAGLGLPACLHVITQLHGSIGVDSRPGQGTTFSILLPASPPAASADLSGAPHHILLIDDDDGWAGFVADTLEAAGKRVTRRADADRSVEAGCILVDDALLARPVSEVLAALGSAGRVERAIVVAAALSVERATAHLQAGVKDVALKPYTPGELAALLA
jgi:GAF domain-containing protein